MHRIKWGYTCLVFNLITQDTFEIIIIIKTYSLKMDKTMRFGYCLRQLVQKSAKKHREREKKKRQETNRKIKYSRLVS